ncbi:MAG: DUF885 domain-containing protein [Rickettsiales bacterium]|nr:DUF885 domain-containing protein [Rickettsiales bacterium]
MKNLLASILFLSILGCSTTDKRETTADFDQLTDDYLQVFWGLSPGWASWAGLSQYDSVLVVPTPSYLEEVKSTTESLLVILNNYPEETLEDLDKIDLNMMKDMLNSAIWSMTEFMSREWDPSETNIAFRVGMIMNRPDSMDIKLKTLNALLTNAPEFYRVRLANVKTPSKPHLDLAILQNQGTLNYLTSLEGTVESAEISSDQKKELTSKIKNTKAAVEEFISGLEVFVETENFKDSRIGKELFEQKYKHEINSEYSAKEIYELAQAEKARLHAQMIVISDTLWSSYLPENSKPADSLVMVKMLIDKIAENHVERDSFFVEINRQVKELAAFVDEKDLLTQDPSKPLQVRETPEYMRGIAGASITPPGPYEEDGITYYNVTPLDDYTDEQAESYLREYNDYILQILNIHEAIPGHYTQLVYSNKSKSLIKSILGNGAMIEGWANYTEIMMLEEGYNNSPEMWLMRNKWHLRGVTNTILDYSYHVLNLTQEEAMSLMLDGAFQEQAEAEEKWIRLTRSSVQLSSYFTGFTQIYSFGRRLKQNKRRTLT